MKKGYWGDRTGGVMMEYVILAVLVAAALIVAVVAFSRSVGDGFFVSSKALTLREKGAKELLDSERIRRDKDIKSGKDYHDTMHEAQ